MSVCRSKTLTLYENVIAAQHETFDCENAQDYCVSFDFALQIIIVLFDIITQT